MKKHFIFLLILVAVAVLVTAFTHYQHTSPQRPANHFASMERFHSSVDRDNDGVDDQADILEGALRYIETCPKYKSKYYASGYPDDEYGVCTDVVANAMKAAGYDLMALVQADIAAHPDDYDINIPDPCIDFRRVKNLLVYFSHTAIPLTTDVSKVEEWQGGDIVIFENHIGIVSDRRNQAGVPYVIHHYGPWQAFFEEDILASRTDITGHFRVSQ